MSSAVAEWNARPGHPDWGLAHPALAREIEGYASATSVERGGVIALYVNTRAPAFTLEVVRFGWYRGSGARRVFGPVTVRGTVQPEPAVDAATGLVECAWRDPFVSSTADAQGAWTRSVHLVRLTAADCAAQSWIVFVVRDDTRRTDVLLQLPVTTWQAYNAWGGKSLYHWGSSDGQRAAAVSFNRPYAANAQNPAAADGVGAGEFLTNLQPRPDCYGASNAASDCNLVRWLEREGHDVAYCTSHDTHMQAPSRARCKAWLSSGHDEYWSRAIPARGSADRRDVHGRSGRWRHRRRRARTLAVRRVFATGSMQWAWGLDDFNAPALRPSRHSAAAERITRNLLARMLR